MQILVHSKEMERWWPGFSGESPIHINRSTVNYILLHSNKINNNFRLPTGVLGALQTDEKFYGQGYGRLVLKHISKTIAKMGNDIYAGILEENTPSRSLFEKIGFKSISNVHWIGTPNGKKADD